MKDEEKAKCCVKCGKCEKVCPQHLSIRRDLELAQKDLDSGQRHRSKRTAVAAAQKWADRVTNKERYRFL